MRITLKSFALDLLAGFTAVCALIAATVTVVTRSSWDIRWFLILTAAFFFLAGFIRSRSGPGNLWLKGLLVGSAGFATMIVLFLTGNAFTDRFWLVSIVATSLLSTIAGLATRRLWMAGRRAPAFGLASVCFAAFLVGNLVVAPRLVAARACRHVDAMAPSFALLAADGRLMNSSEFSGRVVVLAFWATWCAPCRHELAELGRFYTGYRGNPRVIFLAVDVSRGGDTIQTAQSFLKQQGWDLPLAFDNHGVGQALAGSPGLPKVVLLDQAGHIRMIHEGYDGSEGLDAQLGKNVEGLLRSPASKL
jgi:thiol-disulfide isomerase/thioredoxin